MSEHSHSAPHSRDSILDAWRGLSVLLVILSHVIENKVSWSRLGLIGVDRPVIAGETYRLDHYIGGLGVQFFFVISGYIITTLLLREQQRNGRVSIGAFYVRRAFRILPPLAVVLAATWLLWSLGIISVTPRSFLLASTFLCDTSLGDCGWFAGHTWSLAVEEQFYLVWPLLLVALSFRAVARVALVLNVALLLVAQVFFHTGEYGIDNAASFACIAIGCLYATSQKLRSVIAAAATVPTMLLASLLLASQTLIPLWFAGQSRIENLLHPLLICFVIFSCYAHRAFLERRLMVRALAAVGLVSYGIYLWQEMFLGEATEYLRPSILDLAPLCIVFAVLSYFSIERPLMRLGAQLSRRLIDRQRGSSAAAEAKLTA